jgi:hypothetical protein
VSGVVSWDSRFAEPIELPGGVKLASLREAIVHLVNTVPASERSTPVVLTRLRLPSANADIPSRRARHFPFFSLGVFFVFGPGRERANFALEAEMLKRGMLFEVIDWSEDRAKPPFEE